MTTSSLMQAAIVVSSLPKQQAAKLLLRLKPDALKQVLDAVTRLDKLTADEISAALDRLSAEAERWALPIDTGEGKKYAEAKRQLAVALSDPQKGFLTGHTNEEQGPFAFLVETIPAIRNHLLTEEHPRNIAIVLSTLPPELASEVMKSLEESQRVSVLKRLCEIDEISEEEVVELSFALKLGLKKLLNARQSQAAGLKVASSLLSCSDEETRESLLTHFSQEEPELASKLQRSVFKIDRLLAMDSATIKTILKNVDTSAWAPALKNAPAELQSKILDCMSERPAEFLAHEISEIGYVGSSVEDLARQSIIQVVMRLAREGKIELRKTSREKNFTLLSMTDDQFSSFDATSLIN